MDGVVCTYVRGRTHLKFKVLKKKLCDRKRANESISITRFSMALKKKKFPILNFFQVSML